MEAEAVCIRPLPGVLLLLLLAAHGRLSCAQKGNFLHVSPDRLQFFEYESIILGCKAFNGWPRWTGVRKATEFVSMCLQPPDSPSPPPSPVPSLSPSHHVHHTISWVNCTISSAFETDSGEYWCESGGGEKSDRVNIVVTGGSVILESPSLPVMEGESVTLLCRQKAILQKPANFYKGGVHLWTSHSGKIVIERVSKSDQGRYMCDISGAAASSESWLYVISDTEDKQVASVVLDSPALPVMEGETVTLTCRDEKSSATLPAVFYKDDIFIGTGSAGNMTIDSVHKSHEGFYTCRISGAGESPGKKLSVTDLPAESCQSVFLHFVLRTLLTTVMIAMLLLLLWFQHRGQEKKITWRKKDPEEKTESP